MLESSLSKDDFGMAVFFPDKTVLFETVHKRPRAFKKTFRRFLKLLEALARRDEISFHYGLTGWLKDFGELLAEGLPASLRWISGAGVSRSADARHNMPGEWPAGHRYNWRQNPSSRRCVFRYSWPEGSRYIRSSEPDR